MKRLNAHLPRRHLERGERYAVLMWMCGTELQYKACRPRADYIDSAEIAIERLRAGHEIWLMQSGPLTTTVQRAMGVTA